jgi:hypothetical protein
MTETRRSNSRSHQNIFTTALHVTAMMPTRAGPVAEDLKASPRDLRYLGERYEMPLPTGTIARFIDGRQDVAAHGPKDMPM